ncbi:MAG TPA: hypothetical protein VGH31_00220 [Acidimicrobiales bacterium]
MIKRSAMAIVGVLGLGASVALVPLAPASAATHKKHVAKTHKKHKKSKVTVTTVKRSGGSNPGGSFCVAYQNEEKAAENTKYTAAMTAAIESGNIAGVKAAFKQVQAEEGPLLAKAKSVINQTPANVQAAFNIIIAQLPKEYAAVSSATSLTQLQTAFESFATTPAFKTATDTVTAYVTSQCGTLTTPTT